MAWRYKFDGGIEKALDTDESLYILAAIKAFALEPVQKLPDIPSRFGLTPYDGHTLEIWDDELVKCGYGPLMYGIGTNAAGAITMPLIKSI